jgi:hypothetical protein
VATDVGARCTTRHLLILAFLVAYIGVFSPMLSKKKSFVVFSLLAGYFYYRSILYRIFTVAN